MNFQALSHPTEPCNSSKKKNWMNIKLFFLRMNLKINSSNHINSSPRMHLDIHETTCNFNIQGIGKSGWLSILPCNWGTRKRETKLGSLLFSAFSSQKQHFSVSRSTGIVPIHTQGSGSGPLPQNPPSPSLPIWWEIFFFLSSHFISIYTPRKCRTINHHFNQFSIIRWAGVHPNTKLNGTSL